MKVVDAVNYSIANYPSLYLMDNWEDSKFAVLHQNFIVLGNGIEWANTKDPKKGGYLTTPQYHNRKRIRDLPYGKFKYPLDPRCFKEKAYEYGAIGKDREAALFKFIGARLTMDYPEYDNIKLVFESDIPKFKEKWVHEGEKNIPDGTTHVLAPIDAANYNRKNSPYPNFQKTYSCFWEPGSEYIQDDWRQAGIEHLEHWFKYFTEDTETTNYHYRFKPETVEDIKKQAKEKGKVDWVTYLRKNWEWSSFDPDATNQQNADNHWSTKERANTLAFLNETLQRLKTK